MRLTREEQDIEDSFEFQQRETRRTNNELTLQEFDERYLSKLNPFGGQATVNVGGLKVESQAELDRRKEQDVKPILRRIDLMTEEEEREFDSLSKNVTSIYSIADWLDSKGFDRCRLIRGIEYISLIDADLAVDAATLKETQNEYV